MRRFILGWKTLGYGQRFCAEVVNYADDICVLGKAPAAEMLTAVNRLMDGLKLTVNEQKTRCLRCPEEPVEFLGYRIGYNYRPTGQGAYLGPRPSKASIQGICRKISDITGGRVWPTVVRENGGTPEPHHDRMGELLPSRTGQPGLPGSQPARCQAAAPVALSKAPDATREGYALPGSEASRRIWPHPSVAADHGPTESDGMISSASRMRGKPHVRFDERGTGNVVMGAGLRLEAKATA